MINFKNIKKYNGLYHGTGETQRYLISFLLYSYDILVRYSASSSLVSFSLVFGREGGRLRKPMQFVTPASLQ